MSVHWSHTVRSVWGLFCVVARILAIRTCWCPHCSRNLGQGWSNFFSFSLEFFCHSLLRHYSHTLCISFLFSVTPNPTLPRLHSPPFPLLVFLLFFFEDIANGHPLQQSPTNLLHRTTSNLLHYFFLYFSLHSRNILAEYIFKTMTSKLFCPWLN